MTIKSQYDNIKEHKKALEEIGNRLNSVLQDIPTTMTFPYKGKIYTSMNAELRIGLMKIIKILLNQKYIGCRRDNNNAPIDWEDDGGIKK